VDSRTLTFVVLAIVAGMLLVVLDAIRKRWKGQR
jgi:hypothetical protein